MDFFLGQGKKRRNTGLCIPSIFNAVPGKKALFRAAYPYGAPPLAELFYILYQNSIFFSMYERSSSILIRSCCIVSLSRTVTQPSVSESKS